MVLPQTSFLKPLTTSSFWLSNFLQQFQQYRTTSMFSFAQNIFDSAQSASQHPSSQFVTDENGLKWRLCAGAAVFNSKNELLVGERIGKPGSWQAPQGGVDARRKSNSDSLETVTEAAVRELYEEVGLINEQDVSLQKIDIDALPMKSRYNTGGTGSWLEKQGFAGQELHWVVFRCANAVLERDPSSVCNLNGLNGEKPEFNSIQWKSLDWVVENMWKPKVGPYELLRDACSFIETDWEKRCESVDFSGKWSRDAKRGIGVAKALASRGIDYDKAMRKSNEPYIQQWSRSSRNGLEWIVTTFENDGEIPRRTLLYKMGEFKEAYEGTSTLFGGNDGGVAKRCCFYLARGDADGQISHVTVSETPRGQEKAVRYLKNGEMILERTFLHSWHPTDVVSTEIFVRC